MLVLLVPCWCHLPHSIVFQYFDITWQLTGTIALPLHWIILRVNNVSFWLDLAEYHISNSASMTSMGPLPWWASLQFKNMFHTHLDHLQSKDTMSWWTVIYASAVSEGLLLDRAPGQPKCIHTFNLRFFEPADTQIKCGEVSEITTVFFSKNPFFPWKYRTLNTLVCLMLVERRSKITFF